MQVHKRSWEIWVYVLYLVMNYGLFSLVMVFVSCKQASSGLQFFLSRNAKKKWLVICISSISRGIWVGLTGWLRAKLFPPTRKQLHILLIQENSQNALLVQILRFLFKFVFLYIKYFLHLYIHHGFNQRHFDNREYTLFHYNYTSSSSSIRGRWSENIVSWSQAMLTHACVLG